MERKRALVLAGGGSKGAYEVGCIRALRELGYTFDIVCGTSIGALNGLLVAQQDYDALYDLWKHMDINTVMKDPLHFEFSRDSLVSQKNLIKPFFKTYINEKGADITPLLNKIHSLFNPQHLIDSHITYGLVTVAFPSLKPIEITNHDLEQSDVVEYAIASASCFPAFPVHKIHGKGYIDGGYYDNLPISLALNLKADEIIAVELNKEVTHPQFLNRPNITLIRPSWALGVFLDFDREVLDTRMKLGYLDTMKTFKKYKGYRYTLNAFSEDNDIYSFYRLVLNYENMINRPIRSKIVSTSMTPITDLFRESSNLLELEMSDYLLLALENTLEFFAFPYDKIYRYQKVNEEIRDKFMEFYHPDDPIYQQVSSSKTSSRFMEYFKNFSHKEVVAHFYYMIKTENDIEFAISNAVLQTSFLKEYVCALYLSFIIR